MISNIFKKKSKEAFYNSKIILAKDDIDENFVQELLNLVNDVTKKLETLREQTQRELIVMQKAKETLKTFKSQTPINTSFIEVNT